MCNCDECKGNEHCEAHDKEFEEVQKVAAEKDETWAKEFVEDLKEGVNIEFKDFTQEEVNAGLKAFDDEPTTTPKERLYDEIIDLGKKIDKLGSYLKGRNEDGVRLVVADRLTDAQEYLLHKQFEIMNEYYNILCSRYSIFDVKKVAGATGVTSAVEIVKE